MSLSRFEMFKSSFCLATILSHRCLNSSLLTMTLADPVDPFRGSSVPRISFICIEVRSVVIIGGEGVFEIQE